MQTPAPSVFHAFHCSGTRFDLDSTEQRLRVVATTNRGRCFANDWAPDANPTHFEIYQNWRTFRRNWRAYNTANGRYI
jgi:hypothetical protein